MELPEEHSLDRDNGLDDLSNMHAPSSVVKSKKEKKEKKDKKDKKKKDKKLKVKDFADGEGQDDDEDIDNAI